MSSNPKPPLVGGDGIYDESFNKFIKAYETHKDDCPKGVRLKLQREKNGKYHLYLQFKQPGTGKRSPKPCGVDCTPKGVIEAVEKAHKVREALDVIPTVSEFLEWYEVNILGKNTQENDIKTYREIFKIIEDEYFSGYHRNTGKPRSREDLSFIKSFNNVYVSVFQLFPNWDICPSWESMKTALYTPLKNGQTLEGTKTFKERYYRIKAIAQLSPNSKHLLEKLASINPRQKQFKEKQTISKDSFLGWWDNAVEYAETITHPQHNKARKDWLWVAGASVLYGLRPSEITAALNLDKPFKTKEGMIIPALNDPNNKQCYLVLSDWMYPHRQDFPRVSIKTGGRVIAPIPSFELIKKLKLKHPRLPLYTPRKGSKAETIFTGFDHAYSDRMESTKCPITELYAFRRLYNLLCEKYGVPIELRARLMGHSTIVNEAKYKTDGVDATLEVLKGSARSPLSYQLALERLSEAGIDPDLPEVKAILRIVYQLE